MRSALLAVPPSGIGLALLATALFTIAAACGKVAASEVPLIEILFFRQVVLFLSTLGPISRGFPMALKTKHPGLHMVRLIGAFLALFCGLWSVTVLPFAVAITLQFAQVFFVAAFACWFLGERMGATKFMAVMLGFAGVLIILQPSGAGFWDWRAIIPLIGAVGAGMAVVGVRALGRSESAATLLVYQSFFIGVVSGVPLYWIWKTPSPAMFTLLVAIGVLAALGQWLGVLALKRSEASVISVFEYTKLVHAEVIGWIAFDERSQPVTLLGALVIVAAASVMVFQDRRPRSSA